MTKSKFGMLVLAGLAAGAWIAAKTYFDARAAATRSSPGLKKDLEAADRLNKSMALDFIRSASSATETCQAFFATRDNSPKTGAEATRDVSAHRGYRVKFITPCR